MWRTCVPFLCPWISDSYRFCSKIVFQLDLNLDVCAITAYKSMMLRRNRTFIAGDWSWVDLIASASFKCKAAKCPCKMYFYHVANGSWSCRCRCKHKHLDHDPSKAPYTCTKPKCSCVGFDSPFVCNCDCGWKEHKTVFAMKKVSVINKDLIHIPTMGDVVRGADATNSSTGAHDSLTLLKSKQSQKASSLRGNCVS